MPEFILERGGTEDARAFEELPEFLQGYIEAAFFTSAGPDDELDGYGWPDLAPEALAKMREDCAQFVLENVEALAVVLGAEWDGSGKFGPYGAAAAGRDFWFTRNGHGVGFWDRGFKGDGSGVAEDLSEAAQGYGESNLMEGDDSRVYVYP